jgi:hypothetical protein
MIRLIIYLLLLCCILSEVNKLHYCKPKYRLQRQCENESESVCAYPFARYCQGANCGVKYPNKCEACLNPQIESYKKGDCQISAYPNINTHINPNPTTSPTPSTNANTYNIPNRYVGMRVHHYVQPENPGPYVGGVPNPFPNG